MVLGAQHAHGPYHVYMKLSLVSIFLIGLRSFWALVFLHLTWLWLEAYNV